MDTETFVEVIYLQSCNIAPFLRYVVEYIYFSFISFLFLCQEMNCIIMPILIYRPAIIYVIFVLVG